MSIKNYLMSYNRCNGGIKYGTNIIINAPENMIFKDVVFNAMDQQFSIVASSLLSQNDDEEYDYGGNFFEVNGEFLDEISTGADYIYYDLRIEELFNNDEVYYIKVSRETLESMRDMGIDNTDMTEYINIK